MSAEQPAPPVRPPDWPWTVDALGEDAYAVCAAIPRTCVVELVTDQPIAVKDWVAVQIAAQRERPAGPPEVDAAIQRLVDSSQLCEPIDSGYGPHHDGETIRACLRQLRERIAALEALLPDWPGATEEGRRDLLDGYLNRLARLRAEAEALRAPAPKHQPGDGRASLEEAERRIGAASRAAAAQLPQGWGVAVFAFSFPVPGRENFMTWASNVQRRDAVKSLREWLTTNPEDRARDEA